MVRLGLSAALTPYPPPASTTTAIAPHRMRRRFLPFFPFFPFPKLLPLLDIPDPPLFWPRCYQSIRNRPAKVPSSSRYMTMGEAFGQVLGPQLSAKELAADLAEPIRAGFRPSASATLGTAQEVECRDAGSKHQKGEAQKI